MKSNVWLRLVSFDRSFFFVYKNNSWTRVSSSFGWVARKKRNLENVINGLMSSFFMSLTDSRSSHVSFGFLDFTRLGRTINCSGTWRIMAVSTFCACLPIEYGNQTSCFLISKVLGRALVVHLHADVHYCIVWLTSTWLYIYIQYVYIYIYGYTQSPPYPIEADWR